MALDRVGSHSQVFVAPDSPGPWPHPSPDASCLLERQPDQNEDHQSQCMTDTDLDRTIHEVVTHRSVRSARAVHDHSRLEAVAMKSSAQVKMLAGKTLNKNQTNNGKAP